MRAYRITKARKCSIPDDVIRDLGEMLKTKFCSYTEVTGFINSRCKKNWSIELILHILEARGYLCTEEKRHGVKGDKTYYRVITKEFYEKLEEEHRRNVRKRLLETVSC